MRRVVAALVGVAVIAGCTSQESVDDAATTTVGGDETTEQAVPPASEAVPIESTGADELRDLIRPGDPSALMCVVSLGVGPGEFYDKVTDELVFPEDVAFFIAHYADGATVEIRVHPDLLDGEDGRAQADRIAEPIGLLPTELRQGIERVGFLGGDATAQADGGGEGIHVYAENVAVREGTGRFEETIFHESVHTSLDDQFASSDAWLDAQAADGAFLTAYAASQPEREDLAESALYAWALLHHADRVSEADAAAWRASIPNRIAVIDTILSPPGVFDPVDIEACR